MYHRVVVIVVVVSSSDAAVCITPSPSWTHSRAANFVARSALSIALGNWCICPDNPITTMNEETDFNTPNYEDVMAARRVNEFNKPWWEKVTPYTDALTLLAENRTSCPLSASQIGSFSLGLVGLFRFHLGKVKELLRST